MFLSVMLENKTKHSRYSGYSSATVLWNHTGFISSDINLKTFNKIKKASEGLFFTGQTQYSCILKKWGVVQDC